MAGAGLSAASLARGGRGGFSEYMAAGSMSRRYTSIVQWLDETNLIAGAVATLVAISAHTFLSALVQSFILDPLDTHTREVKDLQFTAGRYTVVYGIVLEKLVHLLVVCVFCFAVIVCAQRYLGWT